MRRRTTFISIATTLALAGLILSSTVVAWAAICRMDCQPAPAREATHACCPSADATEDASHAIARVTAPGCCDTGHATACSSASYFDTSQATPAHDQGERALAAVAAVPSVHVLTRPRAVRVPPPMPPPVEPLPTRTIVLLI